MRKIIFTRPDGGLSVVHPVINTIGEADGFTEAQAEQRAWDKLPVDAINPQFVEETEIPTDRTFRNAWKAGAGKVEHDIPKTKLLAHDARRIARTQEFEPFDAVIMKQIPGADAAAAEQSRKDIRVKYALIQEAIDQAQTTEQMKSALGAA